MLIGGWEVKSIASVLIFILRVIYGILVRVDGWRVECAVHASPNQLVTPHLRSILEDVRCVCFLLLNCLLLTKRLVTTHSYPRTCVVSAFAPMLVLSFSCIIAKSEPTTNKSLWEKVTKNTFFSYSLRAVPGIHFCVDAVCGIDEKRSTSDWLGPSDSHVQPISSSCLLISKVRITQQN